MEDVIIQKPGAEQNGTKKNFQDCLVLLLPQPTCLDRNCNIHLHSYILLITNSKNKDIKHNLKVNFNTVVAAAKERGIVHSLCAKHSERRAHSKRPCGIARSQHAKRPEDEACLHTLLSNCRFGVDSDAIEIFDCRSSSKIQCRFSRRAGQRYVSVSGWQYYR